MGRCDVWRALVLGACACACAAAAAGDITVVQLHLSYDELHVLPLNNSVEYIVNFTMPAEARGEASVVWAHSDGGDDTHPVLITVRQRSGALTWQLPYALDGLQLFELERTLCPDAGGAAEDDCVDGASFSLHVSAWCARANLSLRARRAPAWALPLGQPVSAAAMLWSPRVLQFRFGAHEGDVRLVLSSEDSVCASVLVQNYSCPIEQTVDSFSGLRMTMLLSGAVQLSREDYPVGFYVVAAVQATDAACGAGASTADSEWLWAAAMLGRDPATRSPPRRDKAFTIRVEPALSRGQYAVAAAVTLAVFGAFYAGVAALVLAQRWPAFARTVRPRAVLAAAPATDAVDGEARGQQASTSSPSRRRRGSDATYDSSDDSDSDEDYESARDTATTSTSNAANVLANTSDNNLAINSASRNLPPSQADDAGNTIHVVESNGAVDSSVVADSTTDGQPNGSANVNGTQTSPWGLPPQLRLAALARRRGRTLRARSDRYLYMLATVAVFYALPVVQFVIAFQIVMNVSGSLDICYYNFQCAHRLGALSDFNHVLSNLGYLLLGALFLLQVRRRRLRRKRQPRDEEYGIPAHYGLLSALGLCMMVVALLSACYHVCPNRLNFQFDTAFMYVLAVLTMVKIYQTRHPDVNARAHATFGVLAVLIAIVVWGVLGGGGVFWGMFTVLHIFTFLLLSLRIYYLGQFRLEKESLALAASEFRKSARPLYGTRLAMLLVGNAVNWCFAFYGLVTQSSDFASHLLQVLLANALVYMVFYLCMKLVHGERLRWYAGALLAAAAAAWVPALYYFLSGSSDWSAAPALSRHRNHECKVLQFYDNHDLWHILSAIALYLSFSAILTWDDGLSAVKRTDIPVF